MVQPNLYIDASTLGSDVLEEMRDAFLGMSGGLMLMSTFPECRYTGMAFHGRWASPHSR